jgi:hypothetical protein
MGWRCFPQAPPRVSRISPSGRQVYTSASPRSSPPISRGRIETDRADGALIAQAAA